MSKAKSKESYEAVKARFEQLQSAEGETPGEFYPVQEYDIDGEKYYQDYLNIADTIKVTDILKSVDFSKIGKDPVQVLTALENAGKLEAFFSIVLKGEKPVKYDRIRPRVAIKAVMDFFYLNEVSEIIGIVISRLPGAVAKITAAVGTK